MSFAETTALFAETTMPFAETTMSSEVQKPIFWSTQPQQIFFIRQARDSFYLRTFAEPKKQSAGLSLMPLRQKRKVRATQSILLP